MPIATALGVSTGASIWHSRSAAAQEIGWAIYVVGGALLYWGVYHLNQSAVRTSLEPRRQELEALLAGLG